MQLTRGLPLLESGNRISFAWCFSFGSRLEHDVFQVPTVSSLAEFERFRIPAHALGHRAAGGAVAWDRRLATRGRWIHPARGVLKGDMKSPGVMQDDGSQKVMPAVPCAAPTCHLDAPEDRLSMTVGSPEYGVPLCTSLESAQMGMLCQHG